jgi:hypothetical protein
MPKSKSGNSYILSLVDYFTKWPEAIAIPDKKAETIASWHCMFFQYPNGLYCHGTFPLVWFYQTFGKLPL